MTSTKTSSCLMMLELGLIPFQFIIIKKRLFYLYYLLTSCDEKSMTKKVFLKQTEDVKKYSWINQVMKDIKMIDLDLSF